MKLYTVCPRKKYPVKYLLLTVVVVELWFISFYMIHKQKNIIDNCQIKNINFHLHNCIPRVYLNRYLLLTRKASINYFMIIKFTWDLHQVKPYLFELNFHSHVLHVSQQKIIELDLTNKVSLNEWMKMAMNGCILIAAWIKPINSKNKNPIPLFCHKDIKLVVSKMLSTQIFLYL